MLSRIVRPEDVYEGCDVPHWYAIAKGYIGESEIPGIEHNPKIVEMFRLVTGGLFGDETAWCAAGVGACLEKAGYGSTKKLNARSYLDYGTPVFVPKIGDIVILWRGSKNSWMGHVGFYAGEDGDFIILLGGNQNNSFCYMKYPKSRVLGYRKVA